jgi:hypothetical protein
LYENPEPTLKSMFAYILGLEDLEGTVMEARIDEIIEQGP